MEKRRSYRTRQGCAGFSKCGVQAEGDVHITRNSRISVDPPGPSQTRLSFKYAELIKAEFLLQATSQGNAGFPSADDDDGVVSVGILIISVGDMNRIRDIRHGYSVVAEYYEKRNE